MSLKDEFNKVVDNVKDTLHEGAHRSEADAERAKRDVAGDAMTPGEKAGSALNEAGHTVAAEFDATKRDVRNA